MNGQIKIVRMALKHRRLSSSVILLSNGCEKASPFTDCRSLNSFYVMKFGPGDAGEILSLFSEEYLVHVSFPGSGVAKILFITSIRVK